MGELKHYDPDLVTTIFAAIPLTGFAEDTMVTIEEEDDAFTEVGGVDGDVSRSKVLGRRATITFHLMSTSRANAALSALHEQDLQSAGGAGVAPMMVKDGNGISVFATDKAWIAKRPTVTYGKQATSREWKIRAVNYAFFEGGT